MIHPREQEILNILWASGREMSSLDIIEISSLSQSTVQTVLRKLLKENIVEVASITHSSNVLTRTFKPTQKSKELILQQYVNQYATIQNIVSLEEVIDSLKVIYSGK